MKLLYLALAFALAAQAQSGISGVVRRAGGQPLNGADVRVQNELTGTRWSVQSGDDGRYSVASLPEGQYKVTVRIAGFRTVSRSGLTIDSRAAVNLDFVMELPILHEVVTVTSGGDDLDPSAGDSLKLTRSSAGAALPTNGRDFRASFDLLPGVVVTPAAVSDAGQFSSNGQRPNASSYRVDGISVNTGVGGSALPGSLPGASLPAMNAIGSTENLASSDTALSIEFRTSGFTPEFGNRTGAEALVTTRSGTNDFHGDFFGHVRDNGWTARDWFANSRGLGFPRPWYHNMGAVFGGPVIRNRTFVFLSAERSSVFFSGLELVSVPSLATRRNAPAAVQPLLNSFPQPTGPDIGKGLAEGILDLSTTASLASYSVRVDQSLGSRGNFFARVVEAPSASQSVSFDINNGRHNWKSLTLGATVGQSGGLIHDVRFNYSRDFLSTHLSDLYGVFQVGGLTSFTPPPEFGALPWNARTVLGLSIPGLGQFIGGVMGNPRQDQREVRYTISKDRESHQFRAGADYIRLLDSRDAPGATILGTATSIDSLVRGDPLALTYSTLPQFGKSIDIASVFAQDTFRLNSRLNLVYGVRWEFTPPGGSQFQIPTVSGLWTAGGWRESHPGDVNGSAPWPVRMGQIAPRMGAAWRLPRWGLVLHAGAGLFYDTSLGAAINPINGGPFNSWLLASGTTGVAAGDSTTTSIPPGSIPPDVQRFLSGPTAPLKLPASWQWRTSLDRSAGERGTVSIAYVGSIGRNLLGNEAYVEPATGVLDRALTLTQNSSNYQALQLRYTGSFRPGLFASAAYTWSHSLDDGSQDSSVFSIHPGYRLSEAWASSDFDIRHALTGAVSWRLPSGLPEALAGWTLSTIFRARGGFPVNILTSEQGLGRGFENAGRPDLVRGVPLWVRDASAPGGRRLNAAAFRAPPPGMQGALGRNAINGNGLAQFDLSLRREFSVYRGATLQAGVSVFNLLNHPAFADPVPFLSSPWFGQSTSMQNLMLGSGSPNTGMPPLFQTGGSRSAELTLRFSF